MYTQNQENSLPSSYYEWREDFLSVKEDYYALYLGVEYYIPRLQLVAFCDQYLTFEDAVIEAIAQGLAKVKVKKKIKVSKKQPKQYARLKGIRLC
jgi:hypothetical protein